MDCVELCAGAGGQALGLEQAGFGHAELVEIDADCCKTLQLNRRKWNVREHDLRSFDATHLKGIDLLAGGLPCPPFSTASKQLGEKDERNLFPDAERLIDEAKPRAIMIENVRGFLEPRFADFRTKFRDQLRKLGYHVEWTLLTSSEFGLSQLRPRVVIVGLQSDLVDHFRWPTPEASASATVGELLHDLMGSKGWPHVNAWREAANGIGPTLVGGSKKHGGPDLGPTRAKRAWAELGVDGKGVWDEPPGPDFEGMPRLTVRMCARLQGFPDSWMFHGRKTAAYRQVGNAFPPPVARAVGHQLADALQSAAKSRQMSMAS